MKRFSCTTFIAVHVLYRLWCITFALVLFYINTSFLHFNMPLGVVFVTFVVFNSFIQFTFFSYSRRFFKVFHWIKQGVNSESSNGSSSKITNYYPFAVKMVFLLTRSNRVRRVLFTFDKMHLKWHTSWTHTLYGEHEFSWCDRTFTKMVTTQYSDRKSKFNVPIAWFLISNMNSK